MGISDFVNNILNGMNNNYQITAGTFNPNETMRQTFDRLQQTRLDPLSELQYQQFARKNNQPINDNSYDMRGFFKAKQQGMPVKTEVNPYDGRVHFSDGYVDPLTGNYKSFKSAGNLEKYWEMIPEDMYDDPNVIENARKLGVY